jgi:hypothetical protein
MKFAAVVMFALAVVGGSAVANAGNHPDDCHSISDSVYGVWGCR